MRRRVVLAVAVVIVAGLFFAGCKSNQGDHKAAPVSNTTLAKATYTCPMHPDVISTDANAKCPKCGMALVKKAD